MLPVAHERDCCDPCMHYSAKPVPAVCTLGQCPCQSPERWDWYEGWVTRMAHTCSHNLAHTPHECDGPKAYKAIRCVHMHEETAELQHAYDSCLHSPAAKLYNVLWLTCVQDGEL